MSGFLGGVEIGWQLPVRRNMSDLRLLPVGLVLRCDELRTTAVIHIPPGLTSLLNSSFESPLQC